MIKSRREYDRLEEYLTDEGIFGYTGKILQAYRDGDLEDYLKDEGIFGYTGRIRGIIEGTRGNPGDKCPTCGKPAAAPHRRIVGGKIVEGCVDDFHTGHLPGTSSTKQWHDRKPAKEVRKQMERGRKGLGYGKQNPADTARLKEGAKRYGLLAAKRAAKAVAGMRSNPQIEGHRAELLKKYPKDMLKRDTKRSAWHVHVPLADLSDRELANLPRNAFDDDEWYDLDDDVKEEILKSDPISGPRIEKLAELIKSLDKDAREPDEGYLLESNADFLHEMISEFDLNTLYRDGERGYARGEDATAYENIQDIAEACETSIDDEAFREAFSDVFHDSNNWVEQLGDGYYRNSLVSWGPLHTSLYYEFNNNWDEIDLKAMDDEEIAAAVSEAGGSSLDYITADLLEETRDSKWMTIEISDIETGYSITADPDWEKMKDDMIGSFQASAPEDRPILAIPEDRVVYKFDDGWYMLDLLPTELPAEGKEMRMCVGRADMGYMDAVKRNEIKILSLRDPKGKPKFTFEVPLDRTGRPKAIAQIKGKANRLPGWNPGATNQGEVRGDEVARAVTLTEFLGFDPNKVIDLEPGLRAWKKLGPKKNPGALRSFDKPYTAA